MNPQKLREWLAVAPSIVAKTIEAMPNEAQAATADGVEVGLELELRVRLFDVRQASLTLHLVDPAGMRAAVEIARVL